MTRRYRRAGFTGAFAAAMAAYACSQVSTSPTAILSIQLNPPQLPSIVVGDSLHDTTGAVTTLGAVAFNANGDTVAGAAIRYLMIVGRRVAHVDSVTGQVVGDSAGLARVIASVPGLQTLPQNISVVLQPDTLSPLDSTHYVLDYNQATGRDTLFPIFVKLLNIATPDTTGITPYRLQYAFTNTAPNPNNDPTQVQLVNPALAPQLVDTTDASGHSTLSLRATLLAAPVTDTIGISVYAYLPDHTPVPGSPVHFVVALHIH
jgi:hypothetical protein